MKIFKSLFFLACFFGFTNLVFGQVYTRPRIVPIQPASDPNNKISESSSEKTSSKQPRPPFLQNIIIVGQKEQLKKTSMISPNTAVYNFYLKNSIYSVQTTQSLLNSINSKLGIPYRYGADGPNYYDCSGFVWSVFQEAGINFERTSSKSLWEMSEPVSENEKYKFGTLVFFNRLGHVGIVADENGFYHASRSKGIVYSRFDDYWKKRIVGFRRLKLPQSANTQANSERSLIKISQ
jgi:peptidoglycan endopeptidase LytE